VLSAPEINYIAKISDLSLEETLKRLKAAGLNSVPGAGAEILVDRVRSEISRGKCDTESWLDVHRMCHKLGIRTTATMMYGHVETIEDRLEHLLKIREVQDESLARYGSGFTAFIPWNFQPDNVPLGQNPNIRVTTTVEYLQTLAISRLMLDNIDNFQVSWVTQGQDAAQLGLLYGANDFGSLMIEENVVSQNGTSFKVTVHDIEKTIADAGFTPKRRNNAYQTLN
jgi:cyclic dehypoxanthinyl futalosine synthase